MTYWSGFYVFLVAEQAESIDNPMHEAAKRGATTIYTSEFFHVLFIYLFLTRLFSYAAIPSIQDNSLLVETINATSTFMTSFLSPLKSCYTVCIIANLLHSTALCVYAHICVFKQAIWAGWGNVWRTRLESTGWIRLETLPSTGDATEDIKVTIIVVYKTWQIAYSTLLSQWLNIVS